MVGEQTGRAMLLLLLAIPCYCLVQSEEVHIVTALPHTKEDSKEPSEITEIASEKFNLPQENLKQSTEQLTLSSDQFELLKKLKLPSERDEVEALPLPVPLIGEFPHHFETNSSLSESELSEEGQGE